jgi:hypothetical protein
MKPMVNNVLTLRELPNPSDLKEKLDAQGWLIIRDEVCSVEQFEQVSKLWFSQFHTSATRHDRNQSSPDGLSLQVRSSGHLLAHAEGYYRPCLPPPDVGLLWCKTAPQGAGGETSLFDGAAFFDALPTAIAERLEKENVIYELSWPKDRCNLEFSTSSVEQLVKMFEVNKSISFNFNIDEHLHLHYHAKAVTEDTLGRRRFINGFLAHLPLVTHSHSYQQLQQPGSTTPFGMILQRPRRNQRTPVRRSRISTYQRQLQSDLEQTVRAIR